MGDYASQNVTYDLDASGDSEANKFAVFIHGLRRVKRARIRERGVMLEAMDLVNVDLLSHGRRIRLKLRVDDLYLVGYIIGEDEKATLWEMEDKDNNNKQVLAGSTPLRISVSYVHLEHKRIQIGHQVINWAFKALYSEKDPDHKHVPIQRALLTLAVMLCETTRFQWGFESMYGAINERDSFPLPDWMLSMIKNWKNYSELARKDLPEDIIFPNQVPNNRENMRYPEPAGRDLLDNIILPNQFKNKKKLPERVPDHLFDLYKDRDNELFSNKEFAACAPYFARWLIRLYHIPRLRE